MSIATVVTRGYGSFGSINLLPTLGYSIGEALPSEPTTGLDLALNARRTEYQLNSRRTQYEVKDT
jgi:hypothetical protein